jgi:hypothetical protein
MDSLFSGWESGSDGAGDEIAAANRALVSGGRKVMDAEFFYRMATSRGNPAEIFAAENRLKAAMEEDIRRRGGRLEDIMIAQKNFNHLGQTTKISNTGNWLLLLGLAVSLYYFTKIGV